MNEIERIADQLEREYDGEPWHGSPLTSILEGLSHEQAARTPVEGGHSIWELVLHTTAWKNEVRKRLSGAPAGQPPEGDWPAVGETTPERWTQTLANLETAHRLLVSAVREFPEENLPLPTNDQRTDGLAPTNYELLLGLIQHDVYHAGQISLLKKSAAGR